MDLRGDSVSKIIALLKKCIQTSIIARTCVGTYTGLLTALLLWSGLVPRPLHACVSKEASLLTTLLTSRLRCSHNEYWPVDVDALMAVHTEKMQKRIDAISQHVNEYDDEPTISKYSNEVADIYS